jgi:hypothetical protein
VRKVRKALWNKTGYLIAFLITGFSSFGHVFPVGNHDLFVVKVRETTGLALAQTTSPQRHKATKTHKERKAHFHAHG